MNDMKKIYALMAAALLSAPAAFATMEVLPKDVTTFDIEFHFEGQESYVTGSFEAPKYGPAYYDSSWNWINPEIVGTIDLIEITRKTSDDGATAEPENVVLSFTDVEPGAVMEFRDDKPFEYGHAYMYTIYCYSVDDDGTKNKPSNAYGKNASFYCGEKPMTPTLSAYCDPENPTLLKVTITAPTKDYKGNDLKMPLTKLEVTKYIAWDNQPVLWSYDNPEYGQEIEFTIDTYEQGEQAQLAPYAIGEYGKSDKKDYAFWIGYDAPAQVSNIKVVTNADGSATITWDAPDKGQNSGIFTQEGLKYKISRGVPSGYSYAYTLLAEGLEEPTFLDLCEDLDGPTQVLYQIIASNEYGEGKSTTSGSAVVGPACKLPFYESFYTGGFSGTLTQMWTKEDNGRFNATAQNYSLNIVGCGPNPSPYYGEGFGYFSLEYVYNAGEFKIISPKINLEEAEHPVLSFYTIPLAENPNELKVSVRSDILEEDLELFAKTSGDMAAELGIDATSKPSWEKVILSLDDVAGDVASVVFTAVSPEETELTRQNIFIDEIVVDDYQTVKNVKHVESDGVATITWDVPSNKSFGEPDAYLVYVNDDEPVLVTNKPAVEDPEEGEGDEEAEPALLSDEEEETETEEPAEEVWVPSHSFAAEPSQNYSVKVKALYGDVESNHSEAYEFVGGVEDGLSVISIDKVKNVEYFDVNGLRVAAPAKGQVVIKRVEGENGAVKMQKVVF